MSFIYENNLDLLLANLGAQELLKKAQQADGQTGDWNLRGQVAFYMLNNLKSQIESPVSTESGITNQVQATIGDLDNLSAFAKWLADNKVTWNGQRIAWRSSEAHPDEALEVPAAGNNPPEVFVSKNEILEYLKHLRDNQSPNNKILQVKLNTIIADVNTHLLDKGEKALSNKPEKVAPVTNTVAPGSNVPGAVPGKPGAGEDAKGKPAGGKTDASPQLISQVIQSVPLRVGDIDFNRLITFFNLYKQLVAGDRASSVNKAINDAVTAMDQASKLTVNNMRTFSMSAGPSQVKTWLSPPQGTKYLPLINWLKTILQNTQYVLQDLKNTYADVGSGQPLLGSADRARIMAQIGDGGSESIFDSNWDQLRALEAQVNQVVK
jgi:hypothetical protein